MGHSQSSEDESDEPVEQSKGLLSLPLSNQLPISKDVFQLVAVFLSIKDIGHLGQTCKQCYHYSNLDSLWYALLKRDGFEEVLKESAAMSEQPAKLQYRMASLNRWDTVVGGNVNITEHGALAEHFSSYGTVRTDKAFFRGVHHVVIEVAYTSTYAGVGVIAADTALPGAGRGAWLSPAGACMWVTKSGMWAKTNHVGSVGAHFVSGDKVGVMMCLSRKHPQIFFYHNGTLLSESITLDKKDIKKGLRFCVCLGNGSSKLRTSVTLPESMPPAEK